MKYFGLLFLLGVSFSMGCGDDGSSSSSGGSGSGGSETGGSSSGGNGTGGASTGGSSSGGNGAGGGFAVNDALLTAFCETAVDTAAACGGPAVNLDECRASDEALCAATYLNPDLSEDYLTCLETSCGEGDCFISATSPEADAFNEACAAAHAKCDGGFSDDFCLANVVRVDMIAELNECLALPCESVADCMTSILPPEC